MLCDDLPVAGAGATAAPQQPVLPWYAIGAGGVAMDPSQTGVFQFPRRGRGRPRGTYKDPLKAAEFAAAVAIYGERAYFGDRPPPPPKEVKSGLPSFVRPPVQQNYELDPPPSVFKPYKLVQPYSASAPDVVVRPPSPVSDAEGELTIPTAAAAAAGAVTSTEIHTRSHSTASSLSGRAVVAQMGRPGSVRQGFLPGAHLVVIDGDLRGTHGLCLAYNAPKDLILFEYVQQPSVSLPGQQQVCKVAVRARYVEWYNPQKHEPHVLDRRLCQFTPEGETYDDEDPLLRAISVAEAHASNVPASRLRIPPPPPHLSPEFLRQREAAIRELKTDRLLCNCRDIVYGNYLKCSMGLGGCGGWVHPHCCENLGGLSEQELQGVQASGYTCSVCSEMTNRRQAQLTSRSSVGPNALYMYAQDSSAGVGATGCGGSGPDPVSIARSIHRRALLARAYIKCDQAVFAKDVGGVLIPENNSNFQEYGSFEAREGHEHSQDPHYDHTSTDYFLGGHHWGGGNAGGGGEGFPGFGQFHDESQMLLAANSAVGSGELKRKADFFAQDKLVDKMLIALGLIPCDNAILSQYLTKTGNGSDAMSALLGLGGNSSAASASASAASEESKRMDVPAAGDENEQVQISSVTDVMPALAVWLTNVSVFIPGVYGQEVVQLVPRAKMQELVDGADNVKALLGPNPRSLDLAVLTRSREVLMLFLEHMRSLTWASRRLVDGAVGEFMKKQANPSMSLDARAELEFRLWSALSTAFDNHHKVGVECPSLVVTLRILAWCVASYKLLVSPITANLDAERHAVLRHCKLLMYQSECLAKSNGHYLVHPSVKQGEGMCKPQPTSIRARVGAGVSHLDLAPPPEPSEEYPVYSELNSCLFSFWLGNLVSLPGLPSINMNQIDVADEIDAVNQSENVAAAALLSIMAAEQQALWLPASALRTGVLQKYREKRPYVSKPMSIAPPPRRGASTSDFNSKYYDMGTKEQRQKREIRSLQRAQQAALKSQLREQRKESKLAAKLIGDVGNVSTL